MWTISTPTARGSGGGAKGADNVPTYHGATLVCVCKEPISFSFLSFGITTSNVLLNEADLLVFIIKLIYML